MYLLTVRIPCCLAEQEDIEYVKEIMSSRLFIIHFSQFQNIINCMYLAVLKTCTHIQYLDILIIDIPA